MTSKSNVPIKASTSAKKYRYFNILSFAFLEIYFHLQLVFSKKDWELRERFVFAVQTFRTLSQFIQSAWLLASNPEKT
jgi:hypothetical protein